MSSTDRDYLLDEPPQQPRFGPIREVPPDDVVMRLSGAASDTGWIFERFGADGGFPNGGIWRVAADRQCGPGPFAAWVKRTGPGYLGDSHVWRCRSASDDPQWWGREAAFYESDLATSGWTAGIRAARCYAIDGHDDCRDVWLEAVDVPAASPRICEQATRGLARWQVGNLDAEHSWLSEDWIPIHVWRHGVDNQRTLAHPAWPLAIERGLDPMVREVVVARVTDPAKIQERLREFPRVLTHYDFHTHNIGTVGDEVGILDWAFVGWGPIGHDVGHLVLDLEAGPTCSPPEVWDTMRSAYCDALAAAGWGGDRAVVHRSMAVSNVLRLGWTIDHFLQLVERVPDEKFAAMSAQLAFLASLQDSM